MAEQYCTRMLDFCYQFSHCSPQKKFLLCFLCFKLCIFSRGDSSKSFSYPRVNEGLYATSQRRWIAKKRRTGARQREREMIPFFSSPSPLFSLFRPRVKPPPPPPPHFYCFPSTTTTTTTTFPRGEITWKRAFVGVTIVEQLHTKTRRLWKPISIPLLKRRTKKKINQFPFVTNRCVFDSFCHCFNNVF